MIFHLNSTFCEILAHCGQAGVTRLFRNVVRVLAEVAATMATFAAPSREGRISLSSEGGLWTYSGVHQLWWSVTTGLLQGHVYDLATSDVLGKERVLQCWNSQKASRVHCE
jgi:hypothetical protein